MQKRIIPALMAAALLITGVISIISIHGLQGNARVINYAGVVRGATQRLIKKELNGQPDDELIRRLDGILAELETGDGQNGLVRLDDDSFQDLISQMQAQWAQIKEEIGRVRAGADGARLYQQSEDYFTLADLTVSAAEDYSERQVHTAELGLIFLSALFLLLSAALAWFTAAQTRRQRLLQEAEEKNLLERQQLAQLSEDLRAPMDEISELIYVSDIVTHELLFINETGQRTLNLPKACGQMCYEVLQGLDHPCEFCSTPHLVPGETYTWEHSNQITKRHYLLKDRLIQWEGRPARLEIAFDITEAEAEKQAIRHTLDVEQMVMECVRTLYQGHDLSQSFPVVLEKLGRFLSADRAYLAVARDGRLCTDYEWSLQASETKELSIEDISPKTLERWRAAFGQEGCISYDNIERLREAHPEEYGLLLSHNAHSLVVAPLDQDGRLKGFLVVINPPAERIQSIAPLLQTLCYFLMLTFRRLESEQQLAQLSYYDSLTSFYNRNRFIDDSNALTGASGPVGVVYLDVNGLKDINDQRGHAYGDRVLAECAQMIREAFQDADFYRIGGDEFVILCPGVSQSSFETRLAALRRRFQAGGLCRAAIGAQWAGHFANIHQIIAAADAEMYEDKKNFYRQNPVSNRYRHLSDEALRLSDPEVLREEIRQKRFVVYLQPKLSSSDRSTVGAEALIRYQSRSGSLTLPGNFLPMLEESQLISQIDFYVFECVCFQINAWIEQGKQLLPISVNFSRSSLSQPDFVDSLVRLCRKHGVEQRYLEIELTETSHEADTVDLNGLIQELRQAGFTVSIDDFGTRYANVALLAKAEFDVLKLDRSLVEDVAVNPRARDVVESIVNTCKKLEIQVVAEGIETEDQLSVLRACGVDLVQGFLFSRPIPIGEYEEKFL